MDSVDIIDFLNFGDFVFVDFVRFVDFVDIVDFVFADFVNFEDFVNFVDFFVGLVVAVIEFDVDIDIEE